MKKIILSFALLISVSYSFAQSDKYQGAMSKTLVMLDSAKTPDDYISVAAAFERIGDAEKTQWLPYYYAAFATEMKGFNDPKADKDVVATRAEELIAKAEAVDSKNSEVYVLKNMASTLHMMVDPQTRWQKYGAASAQALATAKQLDPNNPRAYLMEGQATFGTPVQFGGGKDKAKPLFEKSVALFQSQQPAALYPRWGKSLAQNMLAQCQ